MKKQLFLAIVILGFIGAVSAASVGAVPGSISFERVEPGENIEQRVYVTTNVGENFTVEPESFNDNSRRVFDVDNSNRVSEGGSASWFDFSSEEIDPSTSRRVNIDGSDANVEGSFTATLNVPDDAEPGLHFGSIRVNPQIAQGESGAGSNNRGETIIRYGIEVAGNAQRDIIVQDVRGFRLDEDQAAVELLLTNTGTVTASTDSFQIDVIDSSRNNEATLGASSTSIAPGESEWVEAIWSENEGIKEGTYQVDGSVDYFTGQATASGSFSLPEFNVVEVRPDNSPGSDQNQQESIPIWLVFMLLAILTVLMWSFDIEPFWILAIIGGLAIASFILLTGVSNYLLVVLLMAVGIVFYGVM